MKIIIETNSCEYDEKVRKGKVQKELRDTLKRFGYSEKEVDVSVDVRGPAGCELELAYEHGYQKGLAEGAEKYNLAILIQ